MTKTILLCEKINKKGEQLLIDAGFKVKIASSIQPEVLKEEIKGVYGVIVRTSSFPKEVIEAGDALKIISRHGIGLDNIDIPQASKQNVLVANVRGANTYSVAEYAVSAMMTLGRSFFRADQLMRQGKFSDSSASLPGLVSRYHAGGNEIKGKTLGIVGFGDIGKQIVSLTQGLGIDILVYDAFVDIDSPDVTQVSSLDELLTQADFVSLHIPLTANTSGLINTHSFKAMKETAYLINASRGGIVNEADLKEALNSGDIAGAAVDVFETEPPQMDSPLFSADNIILTPHIAGTTQEAIENLSTGAIQNIIDFASGKLPKFAVNAEDLTKMEEK